MAVDHRCANPSLATFSPARLVPCSVVIDAVLSFTSHLFIALVALTGTEITYNYDFDDMLDDIELRQKCLCGARNCAGHIGGKVPYVNSHLSVCVCVFLSSSLSVSSSLLSFFLLSLSQTRLRVLSLFLSLYVSLSHTHTHTHTHTFPSLQVDADKREQWLVRAKKVLEPYRAWKAWWDSQEAGNGHASYTSVSANSVSTTTKDSDGVGDPSQARTTAVAAEAQTKVKVKSEEDNPPQPPQPPQPLQPPQSPPRRAPPSQRVSLESLYDTLQDSVRAGARRFAYVRLCDCAILRLCDCAIL